MQYLILVNTHVVVLASSVIWREARRLVRGERDPLTSSSVDAVASRRSVDYNNRYFALRLSCSRDPQILVSLLNSLLY
jgi:hypothetical protein